MIKRIALLGVVFLSGCAMRRDTAYRPYKSREKKAFVQADRSIALADVQTNFNAYVTNEVVWAGVIKDVRFKETERTVQVAFEVDQRAFNWKKPYQLSAEGEGVFRAGWVVDKPTRISVLQGRAQPGYMIVVYGKPFRVQDGIVQLAATAVRPIKTSKYKVDPPESGKEQAEAD
ncbi:hypothetical protein P4E94_13715 [Pontiellaceae bacterium B12219]|nr:hypothetical protein [Pontiellaceae bacterium B12219]